MELRTHARGPKGSLCGRGERSVPAFVEPTCRRCGPLRASVRSSYVSAAIELLKTHREVSAGQVAYRVHGRRFWRLEDMSLEADQALSDSGLFARASYITGGRFSDVTLWRLK